jgi:hypothetical protein
MTNNQRDAVGDRNESLGRGDLMGDELWFVVAGDQVRRMTLDELDEAFALDVLDASTPVWTEGMETWAPLATVAGLDSASDLPTEDAPDPEDDEETQRTAQGEVLFDSVFPPGAAQHPPKARGARPVEVAFSGPSSVPVALDLDEAVFVRRRGGLGKRRRLLGTVSVLVLTGMFGLNLAIQTRARSLSASAHAAGAAQASMALPAIAAARHPTGSQNPGEAETQRTPEPERLEPDGSDAPPSDGMVHLVAQRAVPSEELPRPAHSVRALDAKQPIQTRSAKRAAKKLRSTAHASGLGKAGPKQRSPRPDLSFDPLDAALPR